MAVGEKPGSELNSVRRPGSGSLTGCSRGLGFDEAIDSTPGSIDRLSWQAFSETGF